mmetsp:Transcript_28588/g.48630  ORF Transcript_28588/g.48630 Transcript_28588/m.48630 type:complete len:293 (+) Transcript_28588:2501-3379(+)
MVAKANVVMPAKNTGGADMPTPNVVPNMAVVNRTRLSAFLKWSTGGGGGGASFLGGGGGGGGTQRSKIFPSWASMVPRQTGSSRSMAYSPLGPWSSMNFTKLLENIIEDTVLSREGRSVWPMMVTPLGVVTTSSTLVPAMLPPASAAKSTQTLPGFSISTMCCSINNGAFLPGISAVEMIMSTSLHCFSNNSRSAARNSGDISFAYPPAPEPSSAISTVRNSPPAETTCSFVAARTSKHLTIAPVFLAVWMACKPATPAPMISTLAGGTLPAAVINDLNERPKCAAASTTAL